MIVCLVTLVIVSDQTAVGQILSNGRQEYGQLDRTEGDSNAEAANSLSVVSPNEPSCEELRMMWRYVKQ